MSARTRRRPAADERLCCVISEQLARAEEAAPHLRAAKRELLLFVRSLVEAELERMEREEREGGAPGGTARRRGPRRVDVRTGGRRRSR